MVITDRRLNSSDLFTVMGYKQESVVFILFKILSLIILGNFCLSQYSFLINLIGFGGIVLVFFHSLYNRDFFSFFIQLFFCNHLVYGSDNGGLYNLAALISIFVVYLLYNENPFTRISSFSKTSINLLIVLAACQLLALVANDRFGTSVKVSSLLVFLLILYTVFNLSKIEIKYTDYIRFIYVLFFFTIYMLAVSVNQRMHVADFFLFPDYTSTAEFELDLIRSGGTFLNYEAYGEYSLSLIALLLPGILSGSIKKISFTLFICSLSIILISLFAIVLSGTRSSLLLLPLAVLIILICQGRRIKFFYLAAFTSLAIGAYLLNDKYEFVDISIFVERSANMDLEHLSFKDIISGGEMNRGDVFDFAFKKIGHSKGLIGEGYYTKEENYVIAHFDRIDFLPTDYHNLYLSSIVLWGIAGAIAFLLIFMFPIFKGFRLFFKKRYLSGLPIDLLLGFNTLFLILMINQYKIQFIRWSNYFVLIFMFLLMYLSLIKNIAADTKK